MTRDERLYQEIYKACEFAVKAMGDDIKTVSWFGHWKNVRKTNQTPHQEKAA